MTALEVLFEDHHLLVMNKPAPLLTQAPEGVPSLEALAKAYLKEKYAKPAGVYLAVPHRLDRPVSGVICLVRNTKAAQRIQAQFEGRSVVKTYWAGVEGTPRPGEWEDWIRKVPEQPRAVPAEPHELGAKRATLTCRLLENGLLELTPQTGRMHQLRVQCAWRGSPVRGDVLYGSTLSFGPPAESPREAVIALHARSLELTHPFTGHRLKFEAPLPDYWQNHQSKESHAAGV